MRAALIVLLLFTACSMDNTGLAIHPDVMVPDVDGSTDTIGTDTDATTPVDTGTDTTPPGRPLGAGCTDDSQCTSAICGKNQGQPAGTCCNGRPDGCNACVGGYLTPANEGARCQLGTCGTVGRPAATNYYCANGNCAPLTTDCCQACNNMNNPGCYIQDSTDPVSPSACTCFAAAGACH